VEPSSFVAIGFGILAAWTFGEFLLIHYLARWAQHTGFSVGLLGGNLAADRSGFPRDIAGFKLCPLDRERYLVRAREWGDGMSADVNLAGIAIAVVRVEGRRWTIDARLSVGFVLLFVAASCMAAWIAVTQSVSVLGRVGLMSWSAFVILGLVMLRGRTRRLFATFGRNLSSMNGV
jgi:hypothetical protein